MVLGALVYFGTGSEWGDTGCQCNVNSVNIYCLHGVNHQIIQYSEKEKVIMDKQTNPQTEFPI